MEQRIGLASLHGPLGRGVCGARRDARVAGCRRDAPGRGLTGVTVSTRRRVRTSGGVLNARELRIEVVDQTVDQIVAVLRDGHVHALGVRLLQLADLCGGGFGDVHRSLSIGSADKSDVLLGASVAYDPPGDRGSTPIELKDRPASSGNKVPTLVNSVTSNPVRPARTKALGVG